MQAYYTTQTWGYRVLSPKHLTFYHILLNQFPVAVFSEYISGVEKVESKIDGSILIHLSENGNSEEVIKELLAFFKQKSQNFLDTPACYYKIPADFRQSLLSWGLAFEGCLALLLQYHKYTKLYVSNHWDYINSTTGGIYLQPFTLLLYEQYPKIVHPITLNNYHARKVIEQTTAQLVRKMFRRIEQAQKGLEGIALLSMVKEKTQLSQSEITHIINTKSFQVKAPIYSPFFTQL